MACEVFIPFRPRAATLTVIEQANTIIDEYLAQDFKLTLRQLFYQFVSRSLLENSFKQYKRLGNIIRNARDGGLVDWDAIEDRTREINNHVFWPNPAGIISAAAEQYLEDLWAGQRYRPEVWIEKEALLGVIEGVCTELRVPYFAHRGNNSQTLQYQAGKRFARYLDLGLIPLVLHLADHDPNGIDMTRDNVERLALYARAPIEVRRIALNLDQVRQCSPPPNFVKEADTRTSGYRERFGTDECWELDALSPAVIANLIRTEIEALIDPKRWRAAIASEEKLAGRIRNLLSMAGNNPNDHEAFAAMERASDLMAEHNLTMAHIEALGTGEERVKDTLLARDRGAEFLLDAGNSIGLNEQLKAKRSTLALPRKERET
jgi:Protein of unknown function (DUF2786)